jgi:hypothetical protein
MVANGICPKHHWVWPDGCSAQFKARRPMYHIARYPGIIDGCQMKWDYFGTGHGKGEVCILKELALPLYSTTSIC